jgi:hypothetical protein
MADKKMICHTLYFFLLVNAAESEGMERKSTAEFNRAIFLKKEY